MCKAWCVAGSPEGGQSFWLVCLDLPHDHGKHAAKIMCFVYMIVNWKIRMEQASSSEFTGLADSAKLVITFPVLQWYHAKKLTNRIVKNNNNQK